MQKWTVIGPEFNLNPEPGYFGFLGPDYVLLTNRRFILPSVRLSWSKVSDFKIVSVEDNLYEVVVTITHALELEPKELRFARFTLVRDQVSHL